MLASEFASPANGFGLFARLSLRGFLIGTTLLHFAEHAFTLHFLLQNTKCLVDIVIADYDLH
ncbi:hypothetical protein SB2_30920 [Methylobacterium radiotolerans]|nr:hypothetical protein SB2_30920 [Methylobacterium radiotolerans]